MNDELINVQISREWVEKWASNTPWGEKAQFIGHRAEDVVILACQEALRTPAVADESILQEAERIINGSRRDDYGSALDSFQRIAKLWEPILEDVDDITAEHVALCLIQLKVARYLNGQQRDSIVDIAGYAGCLEKIANERKA